MRGLCVPEIIKDPPRLSQSICDNLIFRVGIDGRWIDSDLSKPRIRGADGIVLPRSIMNWAGAVVGWKYKYLGQRDQDGNGPRHSLFGLYAEFAACLLMCPSYFYDWLATVAVKPTFTCTGKNTGQDLMKTWVGSDKNIEIKQTTYLDPHLVVRRVAGMPNFDAARDITDSYFVLSRYFQSAHRVRFLGYCDKNHLIAKNEPLSTVGDPHVAIRCELLHPMNKLWERLSG